MLSRRSVDISLYKGTSFLHLLPLRTGSGGSTLRAIQLKLRAATPCSEVSRGNGTPILPGCRAQDASFCRRRPIVDEKVGPQLYFAAIRSGPRCLTSRETKRHCLHHALRAFARQRPLSTRGDTPSTRNDCSSDCAALALLPYADNPGSEAPSQELVLLRYSFSVLSEHPRLVSSRCQLAAEEGGTLG
jgi:hypothetical protein